MCSFHLHTQIAVLLLSSQHVAQTFPIGKILVVLNLGENWSHCFYVRILWGNDNNNQQKKIFSSLESYYLCLQNILIICSGYRFECQLNFKPLFSLSCCDSQSCCNKLVWRICRLPKMLFFLLAKWGIADAARRMAQLCSCD